MFELSVGKLLVLVALILVLWIGVKRVSRADAGRSTRPHAPGPVSPGAKAEDLVRCAACGSYVAAHGSSACGRTDCPWGR
jgi:hypothetical protein